ncbi:hypothetical protein RIF29_40844 [Crotalaria pallida]|uniref:Uncharacterized protein n=1 Tax=Crotalaria pallida TaxID=3830 RepID=A0AAN9HS23_CROPI
MDIVLPAISPESISYDHHSSYKAVVNETAHTADNSFSNTDVSALQPVHVVHNDQVAAVDDSLVSDAILPISEQPDPVVHNDLDLIGAAV